MLERFEKKDKAGQAMGFMDHLLELRRRLWYSAVVVMVCMTVTLCYYNAIMDFMRLPLDQLNVQYAARVDYEAILLKMGMAPHSPELIPLTSSSPLGTMMVVMWLGVFAGFLLSSPFVVYELWSFVAPGLREKEKRAIRPIFLGGIFFFMAGCLIAYKILIPVTLDFIVWLDVDVRVKPLYSVEEYTSLVLNMMVISGCLCEIPLVVAGLARMGLVKPVYLTKYWRFCVLGSFIFGAIFSPGTDVMSMMVFSLLILGIYLVSVLFAFIFYRGESKPAKK